LTPVIQPDPLRGASRSREPAVYCGGDRARVGTDSGKFGLNIRGHERSPIIKLDDRSVGLEFCLRPFQVKFGSSRPPEEVGVIVDRIEIYGTEFALLGAGYPVGPKGGVALYEWAAFDAVGGFDKRMVATAALRDLRGPSTAIQGLWTQVRPRVRDNPFESGHLLSRHGVMNVSVAATSTDAKGALICWGRLIQDGAIAGFRASLKGYCDAKELPIQPLQSEAVTEMSTSKALLRRRRRHGPLRIPRQPAPLSAAMGSATRGSPTDRSEFLRDAANL
jgi:hypothetical protein